MSEFNLAWEHDNMIAGPVPASAARKIYYVEGASDKMALHVYGTTVPTDGTTGFAPGCIFHHTDGSAGSVLYVNDGSETSCDFNNMIEGIEKSSLAGTAGAVGPAPLIWDDAPLLEVMLNPEKGYFLFEDFNANLTVAEIGGTITQNTGSATFTDDPTVAGGVSVLDAAANTANHAGTVSFLAMQCKPGVGTHIYFEVRAKIGVDTGGFIIGLMDDSTSDPLTASIVTNTDHAVFFRDEGMGTAAVGTQACDGTNITTSSTTIADSDKDEFETWGIHIFGDGDTAGDYVKFYHEGALVATVTDADGGGDDGVPDAVICPTFVVDNMGDTIQSKVSIDWMRILVFNATVGTARA